MPAQPPALESSAPQACEEPAPPAEPSTQPEPALSWPEILIRSLLYIGIAGLGVAVLALLVSYQDSLPSSFKFGLVAAFTVAVYALGRLLWKRWSYPRTGLSFIVFAAMLLPLNYYAAKIFGLLEIDQGWLEWGVVATLCGLAYGAINSRVQDPALPFLTVLAGLCAIACFSNHLSPAWVWRGVGAALAASVVIWLSPLSPRRYRLALLLAGGGYGLMAGAVYFYSLPAAAAGEGPPLWQLSLCGFALLPLVSAAALKRRSFVRSLFPPALLALNTLILLKEFSTGRLNASGVLFAVSFLLLSFAWLAKSGATALARWLGRAAETPEGSESARATRAVADLVALCALPLGLSSVVAQTGFQLELLPKLLQGTPLSLWLGLLLGTCYAAYRSRRLAAWLLGSTLLGAAFFFFGGQLLQPGPELRSYAALLWLAGLLLVGAGLGDQPRARLLFHAAIWPFVLGVVGYLVFRGLLEPRHLPSIGVASLAALVFFLLGWPTAQGVRHRIHAGWALATSMLGWAVVLAQLWAWQGPPGWTWALPCFLLLAWAALLSELCHGAARKPAAAGALWVGWLGTAVGIFLLIGQLVLVARLPALAELQPAAAVSVWLSVGLAALVSGFLALRRRSQLPAHVAAGMVPLAVVYGAQNLGAAWPTLAFWLLFQSAAGHLFARVPSLFGPALRHLAGFVFWAFGPLLIGLLCVFAPGSNVAAAIAALTCAYYCECCLRTGQRGIGYAAFAAGFPAVVLLLFRLGLLDLSPVDLASFAGCAAAAVLGLWALAGRERLGSFYAGGQDISWLTLLVGCTILLVGIRRPLPVPALCLAVGWGMASWAAERNGHRRSGLASLLCGAAASATWIYILQRRGATLPELGLGLLLVTAPAGLLGAWFDFLKRHSLALGQLVLFVLVALLSVGLTATAPGHAGLVLLGHAVVLWLGFRIAGRLPLLYGSLLALQPALLLMLLDREIDHSLVPFLFQVLALIFLLVGIWLRKRSSSSARPFLIVGLGVACLAFLSRFVSVAGWQELGPSILLSLCAAVIFGLAAWLLRSRAWAWTSMASLVFAGTLALIHAEVRQAMPYGAMPGLVALGAGLWERLKNRETPLIAEARVWVWTGLLVLFLPALIHALIPGQDLAMLLLAAAALGVLGVGLFVKVRALFLVALVALTMDLGIQLVHWINFAAVPKWVWIALVSVVCIFVGFMSERRFNRAVRGSVEQARSHIKGFLEGWV